MAHRQARSQVDGSNKSIFGDTLLVSLLIFKLLDISVCVKDLLETLLDVSFKSFFLLVSIC